MLYLLIKVLSHANAKKKTERLKGFKFCTLIGHYGSERVKCCKQFRLQRCQNSVSVCRCFSVVCSLTCSNISKCNVYDLAVYDQNKTDWRRGRKGTGNKLVFVVVVLLLFFVDIIR